MKYNLKTPCIECPFRCSVDLHLNPGRKQRIVNDLRHDKIFPCHMSRMNVHCAGALIVMEKTGEIWNNWMLRWARYYYFKVEELDMNAPVFKTLDEFARDK